MQKKIILITNNEYIGEKIKQKIILLREKDIVEIFSQEKVFEKIKEKTPDLIFYHLENKEKEAEKFINFLQRKKQTKELCFSSIILLYEILDENIICNCFEEGLTDFLPINATDSELTIRTIWGLQKKEQQKENDEKNSLLAQLNVIDKKNNAFTEQYTNTVIKEDSQKNWGTFVVLAPDINIRNKTSPQTLMSSIKRIVRVDDILGYATDFKIYLWFRETNKEDVLIILEKIKKNLTNVGSISAGYIETKDVPFDLAEELANKYLSKALLKGNCFLHASEPVKKDVDIELNIKNFKQQKENLEKSLEDILTPLFYQYQTINEEKLFETQITQKITKEKSYFNLENTKGKSRLSISYPGFTKINIEVLHDIKQQEIKAQKFYIDSNDVTKEKLEFLLNSFIKDFKEYTNC